MKTKIQYLLFCTLLLIPWFVTIPIALAACSTPNKAVDFSSANASPVKLTKESPTSTFSVRVNTACKPEEIYDLVFDVPGYNIPKTSATNIIASDWTYSSSTKLYRANVQVFMADPFQGQLDTTLKIGWRPILLLGSEQIKLGSNASNSLIQVTRDKGYTIAPAPTKGGGPAPTKGGGPAPTIGVNSGTDYGGDLGSLDNPLKAGTLPELVALIIKVLLGLIAMVAVVVIIISGFKMVMNGGNPTAIASAKSGIIWAILGLVVALMSFSIVSILQRLIEK